MNPEYSDLGIVPLEITLRDEVGVRLGEDALGTVGTTIHSLLERQAYYKEQIRQLREKYFYNFGSSGSVGGKYIVDRLTGKILK